MDDDLDAMPLLLDSITDGRADAAGQVAISGSHGGLYPARLASALGLRAVIFNDAGIGLERAGIAGVMALDEAGMAAAAVAGPSARIGDAADALAHGRISHANRMARHCGVGAGMSVKQAARLLAGAAPPTGRLPPPTEARRERRLENGLLLHLLDSASMIGPEHTGEAVVTGSHGGLIGGDPARALKARTRIVVFNDAGLGPGEAGAARLPALAGQGLAAVTLAAMSARIGDAASGLETGIISRANPPATQLGAREGLALRDWLAAL